jgi:hypothetical protein
MVDYSDLEFDEEKYYLGKLCPRDHDWKGTRRSLRRYRKNESGYCVKCSIERNKEYKCKNREHCIKYSREYKRKNKEVLRIKGKKYREENRDFCNWTNEQWRRRNPNYGKNYHEDHYFETVKEHRVYGKKYYADNKKRMNCRAREWEKDNKGRVRKNNRERYRDNIIVVRVNSLRYRLENTEAVYARTEKWRSGNRNHIKMYDYKKYYWKEVMRYLREVEAPDIVIVLTMEIVDYYTELAILLKDSYKGKEWKEYIMGVRRLLEKHEEHVVKLLDDTNIKPQFLLKSTDKAVNTHLGILREEKSRVIVNAFNHPSEVAALLEF